MTARKTLLASAAVGGAALTLSVLPATASSTTTEAAPAGTQAVATFDASTDTTPQLLNGETSPRGQFTYNQVEDSADLNDVTVSGTVTGLRPNRSYVTVLYSDAFCLQTPSVTAFPSAPFKTDASGSATLSNLNLNPQSLNALRTFDIEDTRSASIRDVLLPGQLVGGLPITTPTLPNGAETEACTTSPAVN